MSSSTALSTKSQPKKVAKRSPWLWSGDCKYEVIKSVAKDNGYKLQDSEQSEAKSNMFWVDVATIQDRFKTILPWQMMNHFPGMPNIARKQRMGQNLNKMQKVFPKEYGFYPRTWILPAEMSDFRQQFDNQGNSMNGKIFIIKPDAGCQGKGIFLTKTFDTVPQQEMVVAQIYIKKPLLIDGFKFDLRIYTLITCVKPLRMYLFHDGLVRLCTEEYVKPTKQNLHMTTMHLTNYSLNKNADGFVQSEGTESGEGSKRSLSWFMNMIREEKGNAKADWLWRRMGRLCVRTIVSILPMLTREYDQHFKSFANVPYNVNVTTEKSSSFIKVNQGGNTSSNTSSNSNGNGGNKTQAKSATSNASSDDDDDDDDDEDDDEDDEEDGDDSDAAPPKKKQREPELRGSRCFEILGIDIMLDSNLKPWLIEINHLPSFGTDSPLDQDIKERLMRQVFKVLPTRADDEQAYALFHKSEAAKRLTGKGGNVAQRMAEKAAREKAEAERLKKERAQRNQEQMTIPDGDRGLSAEAAEEKRRAEELAAELEAERLAREAIQKEEDEKAAEIAANAAADPEDEECTPERLVEITATLIEIYKEYSPDKVNKINRLLQKYIGREEEFLRFVYHKYNITPPVKDPKPVVEDVDVFNVPAAPISSPNSIANNPSLSNVADKSTASDANSAQNGSDQGSRAPEQPKNGKAKDQNKNPRRYSSRSVSPPAASSRRAPANWKLQGVEGDTAFRREVLETVLPKTDDLWMEIEMQNLSEFTRIFPEVEIDSATSKKREEEDAREEAEEDEDGDDDEDSTPQKNGASYEDVIIQSFAIDKRQTMRLYHPLVSRVRPVSEPDERDATSLPPVDNRPAFGSIASTAGKGVVGWRQPPKKVAGESATTKVPTQNQLDAAKRLSLGLSVNKQNSVRNRGASNNNLNPTVVLDPDSGQGTVNWAAMTPQEQVRTAQQLGIPIGPNGLPMLSQDGMGLSDDASVGSMHGGMHQQISWPALQSSLEDIQTGRGIAGGNQGQGSWVQGGPNGGTQGGMAPQARQRLMEEAKLTRMRLEAARNTPAAVLRQQVYRFSESEGGGALGMDIDPQSAEGQQIMAMQLQAQQQQLQQHPPQNQQPILQQDQLQQQQQQQQQLYQQQLMIQQQMQAQAMQAQQQQQQQLHQQQQKQQHQQRQQQPLNPQSIKMDGATQIQQADALRKEMYRQQVSQQQQQLFQANTQRQQFAVQAQAQRQFLQQQQANLQHPQTGQSQYFGIGGGQVQQQGSLIDSSGNGIISNGSGQQVHVRPQGSGATSAALGNAGLRPGLKAGTKYGQYQASGGKVMNQSQAQASAQAQAVAQANGENPQDALLRELFPGWFP